MKILIIQEKGRHIPNQNFREALNMQRALLRIGHECIVWGLGYNNFSKSFSEFESWCDAILLLENYENGKWVPNLSNSKKLKLFWSIDSHCILNQHVATCRKQKIDVLLNSTSGYLSKFDVLKKYWFPNAYPADLIRPIDEIEKTVDLGFCGNYCNRKAWLDNIGQHFPIQIDIFVIGDSMVKTVNSYKIHWNRNIKDDINYRTFETMGCNTLLFTNKTDRVADLFDLEKDMVIYESLDDFLEKLYFYLDNPEKRQEISQHGHETVKSKHTYDNRAIQLVDIIMENI